LAGLQRSQSGEEPRYRAGEHQPPIERFGYLHLAELGGDPASGNVGMLDLIAALQWVRDNIANFGGDPASVTVFGQSGGGAKVATTLAMPSAKGLRHKAIVESGAALRVGDAERATDRARRLMAALDVSDISALRQVPATKILAASRALEGGPGWGPVLDGVVITAHPFDPVANPAEQLCRADHIMRASERILSDRLVLRRPTREDAAAQLLCKGIC
jgi:carboxylesterase type B